MLGRIRSVCSTKPLGATLVREIPFWIAVSLCLRVIAACGGDGGPQPPITNPDVGFSMDAGSRECFEDDDQCSGERICINGRCEAAFPRFYEAYVRSGEAPANNPAGGCWDDCLGPGNSNRPDLYVQIRVDGVDGARTAIDVDTWFGDWAVPLEFNVIAGSTVEFALYDEDVLSDGLGADELIINCVADPLEPRLLRGRFIGCGGSEEEVGISIELQPK